MMHCSTGSVPAATSLWGHQTLRRAALRALALAQHKQRVHPPPPPPWGTDRNGLCQALGWAQPYFAVLFWGSLARWREKAASDLEWGSEVGANSLHSAQPKEAKAPLFSASALETDSSILKQDSLINHLLDLCSFT